MHVILASLGAGPIWTRGGLTPTLERPVLRRIGATPCVPNAFATSAKGAATLDLESLVLPRELPGSVAASVAIACRAARLFWQEISSSPILV